MGKKKFDIEGVLASAKLSDVIGSRIDLTKDGREFKACCPFHRENTPSFTVNDDKGFYHCFGCGAHGDAIDFIQEYDGVSWADAVNNLQGGMDISGNIPIKKETVKHDPYENIEPMPTPEGEAIEKGVSVVITNPKRDTVRSYKPEAVYPYRTKSGDLIGYVIRMELFDGKKITPQILWAKDKKTGKEGWYYHSLPELRTPYRLEKMSDTKTIVIAEGEKCADALGNITNRVDSLAWCGGTNATDKTDWSFVIGRSVVLWSDSDEVGKACMEKIAEKIEPIAKAVKIIHIEDKPKGWDVADAIDEGATRVDVLNLIKENAKPYVKPELEPEPEPEQTPEPAKEESKNSNFNVFEALKDEFKFLGYTNGTYHFLRFRTGLVRDYSATQLNNMSNLCELAPKAYWDSIIENEHGKGSKKEAVQAIADSMIRKSESVGFFDRERIRGRGAWMDEDRFVFHCGDKLIVDGEEIKLRDFKSKYLYQYKAEMGIGDEPISDIEASQVLEALRPLRWKEEADVMTFAGWVVSAPVAGILPWRSHVYINAPMGSGKSEITGIAKKLMANNCIASQGNSTEAGIRQAIDSDVLPVLFDEAEKKKKGENNNAPDKIDEVLFLARQASSETGGSVVKGSSDQTNKNYLIKSPFMFASIANNVQDAADASRSLPIKLAKREGANDEADRKAWKEFEEKMTTLFTDKFCQGLVRRSIELMPIIKENQKTFKNAGREFFGDARTADTYAMIFAGLYALHKSDKVTEEAATKWINSQDWIKSSVERKKIVAQNSDIDDMIDQILQKRIRRSNKEIALADLLGSYCDDADPSAKPDLEAYGIKYVKKDGLVYFSQTSNDIQKALANTKFYTGWFDTMCDVEGSVRPSKVIRFGKRVSRAVGLPVEMVLK